MSAVRAEHLILSAAATANCVAYRAMRKFSPAPLDTTWTLPSFQLVILFEKITHLPANDDLESTINNSDKEYGQMYWIHHRLENQDNRTNI